MQHFEDSFALASEPQAIAARLTADCEELQHVKEAAPRIAVFFSQRALFLHGGQKAAVIIAPRWQGPLGLMAGFLLAQACAPLLEWEDPDFVILVDAAVWSSLDAERRERLMFHELSHVVWVEDEFGVGKRNRETGRPIIKLGPHDCEIFDSELRRYGPEVVGIETTLQAIVEGAAEARRRRFTVVQKSA